MGKKSFGEGDKVMLKSGGPVMTVHSPPKLPFQEHYKCQWFAGRKLESGEFPALSLERAEEQPKVDAQKK